MPLAVKAIAYDELSTENKQQSLFTDGSCKKHSRKQELEILGTPLQEKLPSGRRPEEVWKALKIALEHTQEHQQTHVYRFLDGE